MGLRRYWLIGRAGLAVTGIRCLVRWMPLPRLLNWLHAEASESLPDRAILDDLAYYTDRWLTLFPANAKGNCFPRSLTLYWFARRQGFPVQFHCGIQRNGSSLDGHAWLSLDGAAFLEPTRHWEGFAITYSFPEQRTPGPVGKVPAGAGSGIAPRYR